MRKIKAILIDDEKSSLQNLAQKLKEFCPDVEVLAAIDVPEDAVSAIQQQKPDLLFLDIEMPRMNGFLLLKEIADLGCDIIFTTAYNHYAIDAIRVSAFDYLMKPIAIKDLQDAVERYKKTMSSLVKEKIDILQDSLAAGKSQENKISLATQEGVAFIQIKNIIYVESSSSYSIIHLAEGKKMLVTKLLKDFEEMLLPYHFYRVHHSYLINLNYMEKYVRGDGGHVVLQNGVLIDVARRKKDEFLKVMGL